MWLFEAFSLATMIPATKKQNHTFTHSSQTSSTITDINFQILILSKYCKITVIFLYYQVWKKSWKSRKEVAEGSEAPELWEKQFGVCAFLGQFGTKKVRKKFNFAREYSWAYFSTHKIDNLVVKTCNATKKHNRYYDIYPVFTICVMHASV